MINRQSQWNDAALNSVSQSKSHPLALLLVRDMCLIADDDGRAPLLTLGTRFRNFFRKRAQEGKAELDAHAITNLVTDGSLQEQSIEWWSATIEDRVLPDCPPGWLRREGADIVWISEVWASWSSGFRKAMRNAAEIKLIEYFERHVDGGW